MTEVTIKPLSLERIRETIGGGRFTEFQKQAREAKALLDGRIIWNINSTALGGGVAEMLQPMLAYIRGVGIDVRWLVTEGTAEFFAVTKRLHNNLHGHEGDGGYLAESERKSYESVLASNAQALSSYVRSGDIVICHDPQTAGLIPHLRKSNVIVIWRSHIGHDNPNELVKRGWEFLTPYIEPAHQYVFTRQSYVPPQLDHGKEVIIPPSIDPLSAKNQPMSIEVARSILITTGILEGVNGEAPPQYLREDGSRALVERCADVIHLGRAPDPDRRLVVQVSRWDRLKDPVGVMRGFAEYLENVSASLVLAGPNVSAVADDPEGGEVLDEVFVAWRHLPHEIRKHVHIACLPMTDREENAAIVNALQRYATVVVQKSLYEGFGLTVTEAMWKGRPVIASAVGGIQDQIEHGVHGLLLQDPADIHEFAAAVKSLIDDPARARRMGESARQHVAEKFLFIRQLLQYHEVLIRLIAGESR